MKSCTQGCEFRIKKKEHTYYCNLHNKELISLEATTEDNKIKLLTFRCNSCEEEAEELDVIEDLIWDFCPTAWELIDAKD